MKAKTNVPLATGESLYNRFEFLSLLSARGADIIQPDICVVGGVTEMRRIAAIAESHMGPLTTAVNIHSAPHSRTSSCWSSSHMFTPQWAVDPYMPVDGHMELRPDRPGWGLEVDEKAPQNEDYIHWERKVTRKPDGATAYP
ncbi:enolase C-terminal domain-like protein [Rhizobium nepotum]|uniref:enolase C-terminal domain-like protein n=1 Tax=Rhizobium nepotum TaxID=1035271 RepID=UPI00336A0440